MVKGSPEAFEERGHVLLAIRRVNGGVLFESSEDDGASVERLGPDVGEIGDVDAVRGSGEAGGDEERGEALPLLYRQGPPRSGERHGGRGLRGLVFPKATPGVGDGEFGGKEI